MTMKSIRLLPERMKILSIPDDTFNENHILWKWAWYHSIARISLVKTLTVLSLNASKLISHMHLYSVNVFEAHRDPQMKKIAWESIL